jgi:hypothetical protein
VRRLLAARPWIHWVVVVAVGAALAMSIADDARTVARARAEWGATRPVWIATTDLAPGDALAIEARAVPIALIPDAALAADDAGGPGPLGGVARQHVTAGEMITDADIAALGGPGALVPDGWLAVPVIETPVSGASVGDRVSIASDGFLISADAVVVGHVDQSTLVAVVADAAAAVSAADEAGALTLLLKP